MSWFSCLLSKKLISEPIKVKHVKGRKDLDPVIIPWTQKMLNINLKYGHKWGDDIEEWPLETLIKYSRDLDKCNPYK